MHPGREMALADYMQACELGHEVGCKNQKILAADGVIANVAARAAAKAASTASSGRSSAASSSGIATGATMTTTMAASTVHVPQSVKSGKVDL